jgi:DNA invertase Pin-like site-specific DNA recombinase
MKPKTERNKRIIRLRKGGRTYDWIALKLGISSTMVKRIYHRHMELQRREKLKQQEASL